MTVLYLEVAYDHDCDSSDAHLRAVVKAVNETGYVVLAEVERPGEPRRPL